MSGKGKGFAPKSKKIEAAPPELRALPKPQEEALSVKPTTARVGMFQKKEKVVAPTAVPGGIVAATAAAKPALKPAVKPVWSVPKAAVALQPAVIREAEMVEDTDSVAAAQAATAQAATAQAATAQAATAQAATAQPKKKIQFKKEFAAPPPPATEEDEELAAAVAAEEAAMAEEGVAGEFTDLEGDYKEIADLLIAEEEKDPYDAPAPAAYVPESRRAFSNFITQTFNAYSLEAAPGAGTMPTGEKYPYQKFVREYMRQASPYRGLLVYHGLGSGKTCTAIAASEALFSTAKKKIIVMTPFSLRKNFLKEVSLCGFRHFHLKNFWVPIPKGDPAAELFAREVLGVGAAHYKKASNIWVPDFRKEPTDSNYADLSADEQTEIREQILSILVWDAKTNPTGRIRFINYNGIPARKLQEIACDTTNRFFDDAVIVIDEVHNVVRLMQGTIDPYLTPVKSLKRLIPHEEITAERWKPSLCDSASGRKYARGYLFYRMLLDAQNSKIIGLSGTPLINFSEELGILMNVLHGYIPTVEAFIDKVGEEAHKKIRAVATANPYVDFVEVKEDPKGSGSILTATYLPPGIKKVGDAGVMRMPPEEAAPTFEEITEQLAAEFQKLSYSFSPTLKANALFPPTADGFRSKFLTGSKEVLGAGAGAKKAELLKNDIVLLKRMTGLVSYYKGSREDLMPRVAVDEVVRVPMSLYSQKMYSEARKEEIVKEKKPSGGDTGFSGVWAEVYDVGSGKKSSNYKMASRQACNFTFPSEITRPKPRTRAEQLREAASGQAAAEDIVDTAPDSAEPKGDAEAFPELEAAEKADAADIAEAAADDLAAEEEADAEADAAAAPVAAASAALVPTTTAPVEAQDGGGDGDDDVAPSAAAGDDEPTPTTTEPKKSKPGFLKEALAKKAAQLKADCKTGLKPGEKYADALHRTRECLAGPYQGKLKLGGPLEEISPKFAEMLKRIGAAKGSSLVYSQFLDMEGIGIFRLAMDANGYAPIEILSGGAGGGVVFSKRTLDSLKPGPGGEPSTVPRYITFSGGEAEEIRRYALDIFNANFNELPANLQEPLVAAGYKNNHRGEICRVFCITSAGAEGLSLKCVRAVHLMEPYWNDVRMKQVKGRAIRIGSHLELPESERDVSIYTYLTCFSEAAQLAKMGDERIDETIRNQDKLLAPEAKALGVPVPAGAMSYVLTTDERLHVIAERKKAITNALEGLMKAGAADCALNVAENGVLCQSLKGSVGDFMYHPDLDIDIAESASKFDRVAVQPPPGDALRAAEAVAAAPPKPKLHPGLPAGFIQANFRDKPYWMKEVADGFELYAPNDVNPDHMIAKAGKKKSEKTGKFLPAPPVARMAWAKAQGIQF
jgi:hypothetical protein